ncbi:MAG TPA: glycosyltransferase [Novosphingobium sp.]|nr:glycosyltransferase [Novosphingobium sp.]
MDETLTDILFVHQNMPGQFRHLAPELVRSGRFRVFFLTCRQGAGMAGVHTVQYTRPRLEQRSAEPFARPIENSMIFGRAVARAAMDMKRRGINPKLILAHPGGGEGLFLRDVWPAAKILSYAEYYYQPQGGDIGFDPLFPVTPGCVLASRAMNANLLLAHEQADVLLAPTQWQKSRHPELLRDRIEVVFDGIDTDRACPDPQARFALEDGRVLTAADEVITYVARNLEPHRGYHVFMRALPELLARRPCATVLIVGETEAGHSPLPRGFPDWKAKMAAEVDLGEAAGRVHHLGKLPYGRYLDLLRVSSAHVYLTYPFVLSWSCLEAMSAGCVMVASDTPPVREVMRDRREGLLVPFFDREKLLAAIDRAIDDKVLADRLRKGARARVLADYSLRGCLKRQVQLVNDLLDTSVESMMSFVH